MTYVQSYSFDYNYIYDTSTMDWQGTDYVMTTTTARGRVEYETSAVDFTSVAWESSTTLIATTYTGQFGVHSISTTLSNYSSIVSTSSAGSSQSSTLSVSEWTAPEDRYSEYYGSGSTTYAY